MGSKAVSTQRAARTTGRTVTSPPGVRLCRPSRSGSGGRTALRGPERAAGRQLRELAGPLSLLARSGVSGRPDLRSRGWLDTGELRDHTPANSGITRRRTLGLDDTRVQLVMV